MILFLNFRLYNFVSGLTVKRITRISQQNKFKLNRGKANGCWQAKKKKPSTDSVSLICQQVPVVLILPQATGDTDMRCTVEDTRFRQNHEGNKKKGSFWAHLSLTESTPCPFRKQQLMLAFRETCSYEWHSGCDSLRETSGNFTFTSMALERRGWKVKWRARGRQLCTLRSRAQYFPLFPTLWGPSHGGRVCSMVVLGWVLLVKSQGNNKILLWVNWPVVRNVQNTRQSDVERER